MESTAAASPDERLGLLQGVGAYLIWGVLPLYFLLLKAVGAGEILAARIAWSLLLVLGIVVAVRRMPHLMAVARAPRTIGLLTISAALISVNWLTYIWSVQHHHVLEASLGYFLNPLVNVLLGVVVLRERLTRIQLAAVALAAAGVAVLASGAGGYLWITATLAVSFSLYGLVRKVAPVEALEGLAIETALLTPPALLYMAWLYAQGMLVFGRAADLSVVLMLGGILTAVPLLLFAAAARKLPYSTLGLLQYIAPTLQFLLAITIFGEALTARHILCFTLIWGGIGLFVFGLVRRPRATTG